MDFMIEIGWIEAVRLIIQANYDRSHTSFYIICNKSPRWGASSGRCYGSWLFASQSLPSIDAADT
jgi:hypothetical protein